MEVILLWLQDCKKHIAGALETLAALVTNVIPAFSSPVFPSSYHGQAGDLTRSLPLHMLFPICGAALPLAHLDVFQTQGWRRHLLPGTWLLRAA